MSSRTVERNNPAMCAKSPFDKLRAVSKTESPLLRGELPAIAIDGPAGVGKSSVGKDVALRLGWSFIDSGAIYRSLALIAAEQRTPPEIWEETMASLGIRFVSDGNKQRVFIEERDVTKAIRTPEVTAAVKEVADHRGVRDAAHTLQKQLAGGGNVVMEGRDICCYVLPEARYKFFIDASSEARLQRRVRQLAETGIEADTSEVAAAMARRDEEDRRREFAPLTPAPDGFYIDTTHLLKQEVIDLIAGIVEADRAGNG